MGKPHPIELRVRVVAFVKDGNSHREASRHFRVSPRFVNNMIILGAIVRLVDASQTGPSARQQANRAQRMDRRASGTERRSHAR